MTPRHWVALGSFISGIAVEIGRHSAWTELTSTAGAASLLLLVSGFIIAVFSDNPSAPKY